MVRPSAAAAAALLAAGAAAQQGFPGTWELVNPMPGSVTPQGTFFAHPVSTAGCFIVASSDLSAANSTFQYDPSPRVWTEYGQPPGGGNLQPLMFAFGGFVLQLGSSLLDDLNVINMYDTANGAGGPWTTFSLPQSPPGFGFRNGARTVQFGSILYRFAGCDMSGCHNDLWAIDIAQVITTGFQNGGTSLVGWTRIFGDQAGPNYPAPRRDFVLEVEGHTMIIFGGSQGQDSTLMSDFWFFMPGNVAGALAPNAYANAFFAAAQMPAFPGAGMPVARTYAAHGVYGDNLFVFGGYGVPAGAPAGTPGGTLNDMWVNHLPTQTWFPIAQAGGQPWPVPAPGSRSAGIMIGRWFYVILATPPGVGGAPNQLWRWTFPVAPGGGNGGGGGGGSGSGNSAAQTAVVVGHTAGIVVGILIGLANLWLLVVIARSGAGNGLGLSAAASSVGGFYAPKFGGAADSGTYAAPAALN